MKLKEVVLLFVLSSGSLAALAAGPVCQTVFDGNLSYRRPSFGNADELMALISKQADKLTWHAPLLTQGEGWMLAEDAAQTRKEISKAIQNSIRALEDLAALPHQPISPEVKKDIAQLQKLLVEMELSLRPTPGNTYASHSNFANLVEGYDKLINQGVLDKIRVDLTKDPLISETPSSQNYHLRSEFHSEELKLINSYLLPIINPEARVRLDQIFKQKRFSDLWKFFRKDNSMTNPFDRYTISINRGTVKVWKKGTVEDPEKIKNLKGEYIIVDLDTDPHNINVGSAGPGNFSEWQGVVISHGFNSQRSTYDLTILTPEGKLQTFFSNSVMSLVVNRIRKDAYNFNRSYENQKVQIRRVFQDQKWRYSAPLEGTVIRNDSKSLVLKTNKGETIEIPAVVSETDWLEIRGPF